MQSDWCRKHPNQKFFKTFAELSLSLLKKIFKSSSLRIYSIRNEITRINAIILICSRVPDDSRPKPKTPESKIY